MKFQNKKKKKKKLWNVKKIILKKFLPKFSEKLNTFSKRHKSFPKVAINNLRVNFLGKFIEISNKLFSNFE